GGFTSERVGALLITADPYFDTRRDRIVALAAQNRLPAIYQFREYAVAGGLLSYGVSITDAYRNYGVYTAKILKGAKPADLPVLQPTKFETVITTRYTRSPSVFSDSRLSPSFLRTTGARNARTVCGCQPVERVTVAMVAPFGPHSSASTRACFEFARPLG